MCSSPHQFAHLLEDFRNCCPGIGFGFVFGFGYGAIPAFYTENFPTRYRASGASAAYQVAQVYGGGLIPSAISRHCADVAA